MKTTRKLLQFVLKIQHSFARHTHTYTHAYSIIELPIQQTEFWTMKYKTFRMKYIYVKQDVAHCNVIIQKYKRVDVLFDLCWVVCVYVCEVPHVIERIGNYKYPPFSSTLSLLFLRPLPSSLLLCTYGHRIHAYVNSMHSDAVSKWNLFLREWTLFANDCNRHKLRDLRSMDIIHLAKLTPFRLVTKAMTVLDVTPWEIAQLTWALSMKTERNNIKCINVLCAVFCMCSVCWT